MKRLLSLCLLISMGCATVPTLAVSPISSPTLATSSNIQPALTEIVGENIVTSEIDLTSKKISDIAVNFVGEKDSSVTNSFINDFDKSPVLYYDKSTAGAIKPISVDSGKDSSFTLVGVIYVKTRDSEAHDLETFVLLSRVGDTNPYFGKKVSFANGMERYIVLDIASFETKDGAAYISYGYWLADEKFLPRVLVKIVGQTNFDSIVLYYNPDTESLHQSAMYMTAGGILSSIAYIDPALQNGFPLLTDGRQFIWTDNGSGNKSLQIADKDGNIIYDRYDGFSQKWVNSIQESIVAPGQNSDVPLDIINTDAIENVRVQSGPVVSGSFDVDKTALLTDIHQVTLPETLGANLLFELAFLNYWYRGPSPHTGLDIPTETDRANFRHLLLNIQNGKIPASSIQSTIIGFDAQVPGFIQQSIPVFIFPGNVEVPDGVKRIDRINVVFVYAYKKETDNTGAPLPSPDMPRVTILTKNDGVYGGLGFETLIDGTRLIYKVNIRECGFCSPNGRRDIMAGDLAVLMKWVQYNELQGLPKVNGSPKLSNISNNSTSQQGEKYVEQGFRVK